MEPLEPRLLLAFTDATSAVFGTSSIAPTFFDYDNDGWQDAAGWTNHWRLWRNDEGVYSDEGPLSDGLQNGQIFAGDIDNDGWTDLLVGHQGYITVLRNDEGSGSFQKVTHVPPDNGIIGGGGSVGDFNNDGFLDFYRGGYVSNNSQLIVSVPDATQPGGRGFDLAWQGDGRYVRSVTSADYDEDGDLDVYTAAYFLQNNGLFQNQRNGQPFPFINVGLNESGHSVGAQWGDLDNDGDLDIFLGNFAHPGNPEPRVFRNEGPGGGYAMTDIGQRGIYFRESWASPALGDYDNDGNLDLWYGAFGPPSYSSSDTSALFRNTPNTSGPNFSDVTGVQGLGGLYNQAYDSWVDFDNDGDLDLVAAARLFRNDLGNSNSWLKVDLGGDANTIGAIVKVTAGSTTRTRQVESGYGEAKFAPLIIHFGLGSHTGPVDVEITWLDGTTRSFQTAVNQTIDGGGGPDPDPTPTALPYVENFDDGVADSFEAVAAAWSVNGANRYHAAPEAGQDAISLVDLLDPLPSAVSMQATVRGLSVGGLSKNGVLVFDYQGENDFKFAGAFFGQNQLKIGHYDGTSWVAQATATESIATGTDYSLQLLLDGGTATLLVDGVEKLGHSFTGSLLDGDLGLGTNAAEATFDDFVLVGTTTLPFSENFDDGRANFLQPVSGDWSVNASDRYQVDPTGGNAISLVSLSESPPGLFEMSGIARGRIGGPGTNRNVAFIYDYQGPDDFKFAGAYVGSRQWVAGHYDGSSWKVEAQASDPGLAVDVDFDLQVRVDDDTVTLVVDGQSMLDHTFAAPVTGGRVGYGTNNAAAAFDDLVIDVAPVLPYHEDFSDGQANFLTPVSGAWSIDGQQRYTVEPTVGEDGLSVLTLGTALPSVFAVDSVLRGAVGDPTHSKNAVVIFDYQGPSDFKFAGAFFGAGAWQVGHRDATGWIVDATLAEPLQNQQDYLVQLTIRQGAVTLSADGAVKVSHDYGGSLSDGRVGLGSSSAVARFDTLAIREATDLPYFEDFANGAAPFQVPLSGDWQVNEFNRYLASPGADGDAVSLVSLAEPLAGAFSLGGILRPKAGGSSTNAALVFDYRSPTDFKFAAGFVGVGQWWIGHHDGAGWVADAQVDAALADETDYRADLFLSGADVTLRVDGQTVLTHAFADALNDGAVGVGTRQSVAVFDDLSVDTGPTVPHAEDFEDGIADFFFPVQGSWMAASGRYESRAGDEDGVSVLGLGDALPAHFEFSAIVRGQNGAPSRNGLLIFDYQGPADFGYAGGFFGAGQWRMGRYDGSTWSVDATSDEALATGQDYAMTLTIRDGAATLAVDGAEKLSHDFGGDLSGGRVGFATDNALAQFDDVSVAVARDPSGPQVVEVLLRGAQWTGAFIDALASSGAGTGGYLASTGPDQLRAVPWSNVDQIVFRFSDSVLARTGDLSVTDSTGSYGITGMTSDGASQVTWTLDRALQSDHVRIQLSDTIEDATGRRLDGEWVDGQSTRSGDGTAGGALDMSLHILVGSSDQDDATSIYDVAEIRAALDAGAGDAGYSAYADLNGDGVVSSGDFDGLLANQGRRLGNVAGVGAGSMSVTLEGQDRLMTTPSTGTVTGSTDISIRTADGQPADLMDYSVRVRLAGSAVSNGVVLLGGGEALQSPASTGPNPPGVLNTDGNVDLLPDEYYLGTANFHGTVMSVPDGSGLIRVDYEVAAGALGTFTFEIVLDGPGDTALVASDGSTVALSVVSPLLTVTIPGDATGDFVVGADDLSAVLGNFAQNVAVGDLAAGDLTGAGGAPDGVVGAADLNLVLSTFTNQATPPSAARGTPASDQLSRWHGWTTSDDRADETATMSRLLGEILARAGLR